MKNENMNHDEDVLAGFKEMANYISDKDYTPIDNPDSDDDGIDTNTDDDDDFKLTDPNAVNDITDGDGIVDPSTFADPDDITDTDDDDDDDDNPPVNDDDDTNQPIITDDDDESDILEFQVSRTLFRIFNRAVNELATPISPSEILGIANPKIPAVSILVMDSAISSPPSSLMQSA